MLYIVIWYVEYVEQCLRGMNTATYTLQLGQARNSRWSHSPLAPAS